jgi:hypothetical protein
MIQKDQATATISPFMLPGTTQAHSLKNQNDALGVDADLRNSNESTIARQRLEPHLRAASERMVILEGQGRFSEEDTARGSVVCRMWQLMSVRSISRRPPPDPEGQFQTAREPTNMPVTRMNAAGTNSYSSWGRVMGDELPPEYVSEDEERVTPASKQRQVGDQNCVQK